MTPEPITAELGQRRGDTAVRLPLYRRYIAGLWTVGRKLEDLERGHRENMQTPCNKNSSRYRESNSQPSSFPGILIGLFRNSEFHRLTRLLASFTAIGRKKTKEKSTGRSERFGAKKGNLSRSLIDPRPPCCRGLTMKDISKARVFGHWCRRMVTDSR